MEISPSMAAGIALALLGAPPAEGETPFRRGDANVDGVVDLSDGVSTLGFLFLGSTAPGCGDAADADDSGGLDLSDAVFTFGFLFTGGSAIPPPGPTDCGLDATDDALACESYRPGDEARRCPGGPPPFTVELPPHTIAIHGIAFDSPAIDLDLSVHDASGKCLGGRTGDACAWSDRAFETGEEYLSVVNAGHSGDTPYVWRIESRSGPAAGFVASTELLSFLDARNCTAFYAADECEGRPGGALRLLQFPFPDPEDQWVEDGYRFQSPSNYRWARRELVMLVRSAIRETRLRFPGTKPLALGDMSQRDGLTPGLDIGQPRHPEGTHDQGASIDIAYYTTLAADGALEHNPIRVICDAGEGSHDGAYCTPAAAGTHVVDLPRQAYFLAQLFLSPRLRVVGVDRVIAPLLIAEAERQRGLGWIGEPVLQAFTTRLASGEGWPFHHRRIQVSLNRWEE